MQKKKKKEVTKKKIIQEVALASGCKQEIVKEVLDKFFSVLAWHIKATDKVQFPGFGSFEGVHSEATKQEHADGVWEIPAHTRVRFKASTILKDFINSEE